MSLLNLKAVPAAHRPVILILLSGAFTVFLNETLMNVALPGLMRQFDVPATSIQWLTTGFMLTMAVVIPTTGFLLSRYRPIQVFTAAMTLFSTGTLIAVLSPGFEILVLGRVVQASGTAIMMPLLMTTVLRVVPAERRGEMMGSVSLVMSVAPALGPTISGMVMQVLPWRFLFLLMLPVAVLVLVLGRRALKTQPVESSGAGNLDVLSVLLSALGFGGLIYTLSQASGQGGLSAAGLKWPLLIALASLLAFIFRQQHLSRHHIPFLDLRTFAQWPFSHGLALAMMATLSMFGALILLPIYLQGLRGWNALETGLLLMPGALVMGLMGPHVGLWSDRLGARPLVMAGTALIALVFWRYSTIDLDMAQGLLLALQVTLSLGLALTYTPLYSSTMGSLPPHLYSHGSAIFSTMQQVAGAAGAALLVAVMTAQATATAQLGLTSEDAQVLGLRYAYTVAMFTSLVALFLAIWLRSAPRAKQSKAPAGNA